MIPGQHCGHKVEIVAAGIHRPASSTQGAAYTAAQGRALGLSGREAGAFQTVHLGCGIWTAGQLGAAGWCCRSVPWPGRVRQAGEKARADRRCSRWVMPQAVTPERSRFQLMVPGDLENLVLSLTQLCCQHLSLIFLSELVRTTT